MILILLITLLVTIITKLPLLLLVLLIATKQAQSVNELMSKATRKYYEIRFLGKAINIAINIASNVDINSNSNMPKKRRACALHFFGGNCFKA